MPVAGEFHIYLWVNYGCHKRKKWCRSTFKIVSVRRENSKFSFHLQFFFILYFSTHKSSNDGLLIEQPWKYLRIFMHHLCFFWKNFSQGVFKKKCVNENKFNVGRLWNWPWNLEKKYWTVGWLQINEKIILNNFLAQ